MTTASSVRLRWIALVCIGASLWASASAAGQTPLSALERVSQEADARNAAFMKEIAPRAEELDLANIVSVRNLGTTTGRALIRARYDRLGAMLDEIERFNRLEDSRVDASLDHALAGLPEVEVQAMKGGFRRGYDRKTRKYLALYEIQRETIRTVKDLLDLLDRAGATVERDRLTIPSADARVQAGQALRRLGELESAEAAAAAAIGK